LCSDQIAKISEKFFHLYGVVTLTA